MHNVTHVKGESGQEPAVRCNFVKKEQPKTKADENCPDETGQKKKRPPNASKKRQKGEKNRNVSPSSTGSLGWKEEHQKEKGTRTVTWAKGEKLGKRGIKTLLQLRWKT